MKKIKLFLYTLSITFIRPSRYAIILARPLSFSLTFYVVFQLLLVVSATIAIIIFFFLPYRNFIEHFPEQLVQLYPDELVISINNGQVSTNVDEPYAIPIATANPLVDNFTKTSSASAHLRFENLVVIDTQARVSDIHRYHTWSLLTWDTFSYIQQNHIEVIPLSDIQKFDVSEKVVQSLSSRLTPYTNHMALLLISGGIVCLILGLIACIVFVFCGALVIKMLTFLLRRRLPFTTIFQIALHAALVAQTVILLLVFLDLFHEWLFVIAFLTHITITIAILLTMGKIILK